MSIRTEHILARFTPEEAKRIEAFRARFVEKNKADMSASAAVRVLVLAGLTEIERKR